MAHTDEPIVITPASVLCFIVASVFGAWYYFEEHWTANNVMGMGLAVTGIEYINIGSFQIGCILLVRAECDSLLRARV